MFPKEHLPSPTARGLSYAAEDEVEILFAGGKCIAPHLETGG